ncbi:MAG: hypothetical protein ACLUIR_04015 [Faecalibacterium prausnitzii]
MGLTTVRLEASSSFRAWMNWLTGARLAEGLRVGGDGLGGVHEHQRKV